MENLVLQIPETETKSAEREFYPNAYIAIPPNGKACAITGLKHAHLYKLLTGKGKAREFVRVVNLKVPGAKKGKTLFHAGDMLRFLDKIALEQNSGAAAVSEAKVNEKKQKLAPLRSAQAG